MYSFQIIDMYMKDMYNNVHMYDYLKREHIIDTWTSVFIIYV